MKHSALILALGLGLVAACGGPRQSTAPSPAGNRNVASGRSHARRPPVLSKPLPARLDPLGAGQYEKWRLVNTGRTPIYPPLFPPGFWGGFERQGPDGKWRPMLARSGCATVSSQVQALRVGKSVRVSELPPTGRRGPLPAGRYRFVVRFHPKGLKRPGKSARADLNKRMVVAAVRVFEVVGFDAKETKEALAILSGSDVWKCNLATVAIRAFGLGAPPRALAKYLALKPATFNRALDMVRALALLPELPALASAMVAQRGSLMGLAAATLMVGTRCGLAPRVCKLAVGRLYQEIKKSGRPHHEVVRALGAVVRRWPKGTLDLMVGLVLNSGDKSVREQAKAAVSLAFGVARFRPRWKAIQARLLKGAKKTKDPWVRRLIKELIQAARSEMQNKGQGALLGARPAVIVGVGLSGPKPKECVRLRRRLARLYRFWRNAKMKVVMGKPDVVEATGPFWMRRK